MKRTRQGLTVAVVIALILSVFGTAWAQDQAKIDINTASAEQLVDLQRVGPSYAARIVEYREANGPFKTIEDIMNVPGIGEKTFEINKDRLTVKKTK